MNVPLCSSVTAWRNSSWVFRTNRTIPRHRLLNRLARYQQKTDAFFASLNGNGIDGRTLFGLMGSQFRERDRWVCKSTMCA